MAIKPRIPLKVAILRNYVTPEWWGQEMIDDIERLVHQTAPDAVVERYSRIDGGALPDATKFDLVILSGGVYDLTISNADAWVVDVIEWIQRTVALPDAPKIIGLCWGHQVLCRALGGQVVTRPDGYRIGIQNITLTNEGREFFKGFDTVNLHKNHKRILASPPAKFTALADDLEILLSHSNKILMLQGHPEMTKKVHQGILTSGFAALLPDPSEAGVEKTMDDLARPHDGERVFSRAMEWAARPSMTM